jgi:glucokinase
MTYSNSKALNTAKPIFTIGVDVGGTKIVAGLVEQSSGQILSRIKQPTTLGNPDLTLAGIAAAIRASLDAAGVQLTDIKAIGLGIPGKVDAQLGLSVLAVNLAWQNIPVKAWLEDKLQVPCFIENDVRAAALGESVFGTGRGLANLVYLSLGTGIAAGIVINGQLYRGTGGLAGEIGHFCFAPQGPQCKCGAKGCLEALAAGPALAKQAWTVLASEAESTGASSRALWQRLLATDQVPTTELVFEAAALGDVLAIKILDEAADYLSQAICLLMLSFDPELVVLGGGLALAKTVLVERLEAHLLKLAGESPVFNQIFKAEKVQLTSLKRDAGILGAAAIIPPQFGN